MRCGNTRNTHYNARKGTAATDTQCGTACATCYVCHCTLARCVCLSVYLCVCLSVCLSVGRSVGRSVCLSVCLSVFTCVCDRDVVVQRTTRACCTLSVNLLFFENGERRGHDHQEAQGRLCVASLLSLTGVIMPSSRPFLVDLPRVAREGPEATPLASRACCVLTVHFGCQPDSKVSQPCGLKNDLLCSRPLRASVN